MLLMDSCVGKYESKFQRELREQQESQKQDNKEEDYDIGTMFKVVSHDQQRLKMDKDSMDLVESSLFMPWNSSTKDWLDPEVSLK